MNSLQNHYGDAFHSTTSCLYRIRNELIFHVFIPFESDSNWFHFSDLLWFHFEVLAPKNKLLRSKKKLLRFNSYATFRLFCESILIILKNSNKWRMKKQFFLFFLIHLHIVVFGCGAFNRTEKRKLKCPLPEFIVAPTSMCQLDCMDIDLVFFFSLNHWTLNANYSLPARPSSTCWVHLFYFVENCCCHRCSINLQSEYAAKVYVCAVQCFVLLYFVVCRCGTCFFLLFIFRAHIN